MKNKFQYLFDLGYSETEILNYTKEYSEDIIEYLKDNYKAVYENMKYLKNDFHKEFLLKLSVWYMEAFVLPHEIFKKRFEMLKRKFPNNYSEIIEKQFWGYEGMDIKYVTPERVSSDYLYKPFLEMMSVKEEGIVQNSICSLGNLSDRIYKFAILLEEIGLVDVQNEIDEEYLLDLEIGKWEVMQNAKFLIQRDLSKEIILQFLVYCPWIMILSTLEFERILIQNFGKNYVEKIRVLEEENELEEAMMNIVF